MKALEQIVKDYPTEYPEGFTAKEINDLLKLEFPDISLEDFYIELGIVTSMTIDGETITYTKDVYHTVKNIVTNRRSAFEFD